MSQDKSTDSDTQEVSIDRPLPNTESNEKKKKMVQLNLEAVSQSVKNTVISSKPASKKHRVSSSDMSTDSDIADEIRSIHSDLDEIMKNMVTKSALEEIVKKTVKDTILVLKGEINAEIMSEISEEIKAEMKENLVQEVKEEFLENLDSTKKEMLDKSALNSEKIDGINLDINSVRETMSSQAAELRQMKKDLTLCYSEARKALNLANHNHQYSQKNNIKIVGWKEARDERLRPEFCKILNEKTDVNVDPSDILAIHRVPSKVPGPKPVIVKFINSEIKTAVIRKRKTLKSVFSMHDHITPMNAKLIGDLHENPRVHSAWYFNCKVYALDTNGDRHTFECTDNIDLKLRSVRV
ncbi:hypothetical protein FSP39_000343 [Pinctada imbricata]|uniref:Uncharacterized protein n=1 Tax=Pinctada imbricata TaxID=66713 RepID=A0AA88YU38_PINIB|nr:hypothetical protein FSP39_000343 [Pinctada imbricata]